MKYASWIIALLVLGQAATLDAAAEVSENCLGLSLRMKRQDRIDVAYRCGVLRPVSKMQREVTAWKRCNKRDERRLRWLSVQRAHKLEICLDEQLHEAEEAKRRQQRPSTRSDAIGVPNASIARGGSQPLRQRDARRASGQRIKDLLAAGPPIDRTVRVDTPDRRSKTFRSGLMWSYGGKIPGMHCVQWREPSDPHMWDDNYLCTERDVGFQWSFRGPILGRGLKCIQVREKSDPHDWHDNYFCWPRDLDVTFRFSSTGRIAGQNCVAIVEPSDPHTWRDNYLCHTRKAG